MNKSILKFIVAIMILSMISVPIAQTHSAGKVFKTIGEKNKKLIYMYREAEGVSYTVGFPPEKYTATLGDKLEFTITNYTLMDGFMWYVGAGNQEIPIGNMTLDFADGKAQYITNDELYLIGIPLWYLRDQEYKRFIKLYVIVPTADDFWDMFMNYMEKYQVKWQREGTGYQYNFSILDNKGVYFGLMREYKEISVSILGIKPGEKGNITEIDFQLSAKYDKNTGVLLELYLSYTTELNDTTFPFSTRPYHFDLTLISSDIEALTGKPSDIPENTGAELVGPIATIAIVIVVGAFIIGQIIEWRRPKVEL